MPKPISILSTRKIQSAIKRKMLDKNISITDCGFIQTQAVDFKMVEEALKEGCMHFVFTSKNAVDVFTDALAFHRLRVPDKAVVYSLEGKTSSALKTAGLKPMLTATSASQLAQMIIKKGLSKDICFFCSDIRRDELPDQLRAAKILVKEVIVYKTILTPQKLTGNYKAVLFFSTSGAHSFFMKNKLPSKTLCICIGKTTATTIVQYCPDNPIITASKPSVQFMLDKAMQYFENKNTIAII